ncbi:hypothetical protein BGX27_004619, partial [Mortierella sp. AM989]
MRKSIPNLSTASIDGVSEIAPYLKFVSLENEISLLAKNMENWHDIVQNGGGYIEPRKILYVAVAAGTA